MIGSSFHRRGAENAEVSQRREERREGVKKLALFLFSSLLPARPRRSLRLCGEGAFLYRWPIGFNRQFIIKQILSSRTSIRTELCAQGPRTGYYQTRCFHARYSAGRNSHG